MTKKGIKKKKKKLGDKSLVKTRLQRKVTLI